MVRAAHADRARSSGLCRVQATRGRIQGTRDRRDRSDRVRAREPPVADECRRPQSAKAHSGSWVEEFTRLVAQRTQSRVRVRHASHSDIGTPQEYTAHPSHIFVINADGSHGLRLTRAQKYASEQKRSPAWSPNGRTVVFERYDDGDYWISIVGADGAGQLSLTRGYPGEDTDPAWSPDGRKIAFTNVHNGSVYVMRPHGSGRRVLARRNGASHAWDVAWSPDGRRIAFFSDDDLWVMTADGTRPRRLVASPGKESGSLTWSPDGRKIAFSVLERGAPRRSPDADSEIFVVNADGSGLRNLTEHDRVLDVDPAWSPDGRAIAFTSDRDGNAEIYVMNADGSDQRNVSQSPVEDFDPDWSPTD